MIVDPDFMDHWRTGMVADAIQDPMAPIYILRLWAHCQERRSDRFAMPTRGLKAQCKFPGDADIFEAALVEAGFIRRDGDTITVCGWAEKNAALFAAWENGAKGGRPRKDPSKNPPETHGKPDGNPPETHGEPSENPPGTQAKPIREEERREEPSSLRSEEKPPKAPRKRRAPAAELQVVSAEQLVEEGVLLQHATDWLAVRQKKDLPLTLTAWDEVKAQAEKAGMTAAEAVRTAAANAWGGFRHSWLHEAPTGSSRAPPVMNKQEALEQSNRQIAAAWAAKMAGGQQ